MTMLPEFDAALGQRQIDLPPFDPADYRRTVLAPLLASGSVTLHDPYALVALDPQGPFADDHGALRARLAEVAGFWQKERSHPRYKGVAAELVRRRGELEDVLLDPQRRRAARVLATAAAGAAETAKTGHIERLVTAVVARHGGVPRSRLEVLARVAKRDGVSAAALDEVLAHHRIVEDGGGVEAAPAAVRRQIRAALDELGLRGHRREASSLWAYLGLPTTASETELHERYDARFEENSRRPFDRDKTVHADVLSHVKARLLDPAERAAMLAAALDDATTRISDRVAELAIVEGELWPPDVEVLISEVIDADPSLTVDQARAVVRTAAGALGVAVTTMRPPAYQVCPDCQQRHGGALPGAGPVPPAALPVPVPPARGGHASPPPARPVEPAPAPVEPPAPAGPDPAVVADEWRQVEREVTLHHLVAAMSRARGLADLAPESVGPSGVTAAARAAELDAEVSAARADADRAMEIADESEREQALLAVLDRVADLPAAREGLADIPLPGPVSPVAALVDGELRITWSAPDGGRRVTYEVSRVHADPASGRTITQVGATARTETVDPDVTAPPAPGEGQVWWEITARSGPRRSHPVATPPWVGLSDVFGVRAASSPDGVTLTWTLPDDAGDAEVVIERRVVSSGDGPLRRNRVRGSRWRDTDARSGLVYTYTIRLERIDNGRVLRTPGVEVTVAVGSQPSAATSDVPDGRPEIGAVEELRVEDTGTALTLRFAFPEGAQDALVLWRRDRAPAAPGDSDGGRPVTVEDLARDGGFNVPAPHDGRPWYFAVVPVVMVDGEPVFGPLSAIDARTHSGTHVAWSVRPADASGRTMLLDVQTDGPSPTLRLYAQPHEGGDPVALLELPASGTPGRVHEVRVEVEPSLIPAVLELQADAGGHAVWVDDPPVPERTLWGQYTH
ncbi:MAG TPA: hypothetical protein VHE83_14495 [Mycobacteriales bacterium]|nr:hypothetical protein [Mycobacteriales bacterium]